jgi:hypothetical protein
MNYREANLKKKIWKYASGLHSMKEARAITNARLTMGHQIPALVHSGMMAAIATCYYRPFTNNGDGAIGAIDEKIVRRIDPANEPKHRLLKNHRMVSAAHSDPRVREEHSAVCTRDLTLRITKLPQDGIQIGHCLPTFDLDFQHLVGIIALIDNVRTLLAEALDAAIGELYYDNDELSPLAPVRALYDSLTVGEWAEFQLGLDEAIDYTGERSASDTLGSPT